jgi:hypothetical protein
MNADDPERRLKLLYAARNRWLEALVRLAKDRAMSKSSGLPVAGAAIALILATAGCSPTTSDGANTGAIAIDL